jgi:hypothetical protein
VARSAAGPRSRAGPRADERADIGRAVHIEQHQLGAVGGQPIEQRGDDGRRTDRAVDGRLEGKDRRQPPEPGFAAGLIQLGGKDGGQPMGLGAGANREAVVFERIIFGYDVEPGGLDEGRKDGRQAGDAGEAGKGRETDHGRNQNQPIRRAERGIVGCIERMGDCQSTAVRIADHVERQARGGAARFADGEAGCRLPLLDAGAGEARGHRAMARKADRDDMPAARLVEPGDVAQAVGRVGEAVEEDDCAQRPARRCDRDAAVPILQQVRRVHRGLCPIAVLGDPGLARQLVGHLGLYRGEDSLFAAHPLRPVHIVELAGGRFLGDEQVPGLERRAAHRLPAPHDEHRRQQQKRRDNQIFEGPQRERHRADRSRQATLHESLFVSAATLSAAAL